MSKGGVFGFDVVRRFDFDQSVVVMCWEELFGCVVPFRYHTKYQVYVSYVRHFFAAGRVTRQSVENQIVGGGSFIKSVLIFSLNFQKYSGR